MALKCGARDHHCPGHHGLCGRRIEHQDWLAGIHRCSVCRAEKAREAALKQQRRSERQAGKQK